MFHARTRTQWIHQNRILWQVPSVYTAFSETPRQSRISTFGLGWPFNANCRAAPHNSKLRSHQRYIIQTSSPGRWLCEAVIIHLTVFRTSYRARKRATTTLVFFNKEGGREGYWWSHRVAFPLPRAMAQRWKSCLMQSELSAEQSQILTLWAMDFPREQRTTMESSAKPPKSPPQTGQIPTPPTRAGREVGGQLPLDTNLQGVWRKCTLPCLQLTFNT